MLDKNNALLDTDFLNHLLQIKNSTIGQQEIQLFFSHIPQEITVHPLVYEREMFQYHNSFLFQNSIVKVASREEILGNKDRELYYQKVFDDLYRDFKGEANPYQDIWSQWKAKESLGELHCITTCFLCDCNLFLSDDGDAKLIMKHLASKGRGTFLVKNRSMVIEEIKKAGHSELTSKQLKILGKS